MKKTTLAASITVLVSKTMTRLSRVAVAAIALLVALTVGGPATAQELKLAHFVAPTHPYHPVFLWLGEEMNKQTKGAVRIRVFPGGELGANPSQQFDRAVDGVADITFVIPGYTAAQFPRTLLIEYPGIKDDTYSGTKALWAARNLVNDEYKRVKLLSLWTINPAVLFMRDKPIRTLQDLKGLKIRVASKSGADMIKAWGATPVFSPVTEMYNAIQTGVVDGTIIDGGAALGFKLMEICKYATVGMHSTMTSLALVMNRESWNKLSPDNRAVLDALTGPEIAKRNNDAWNVLVGKSMNLMASAPGKELITLSPAEAAKFNAASRTALNDYVADLDKRGMKGTELLKALRSN